MPPLPGLSNLQFLVLGLLLEEPRSGRELRASLQIHGARKSTPAFYQLMARMEDAGLVDGHYAQHEAADQIVRERHYRVTPAGRRAWRASHEFHLEVASWIQPTPARLHA